VADAYLYTVSTWLAGDGVDIAQFLAWWRSAAAAPGVQQALASAAA
jgi:glutathione S-transferase